MTINDAKTFLNYNIKEGVYDLEQFDGWSDEEIIEFAQHEEARADYYADTYLKGEI